MISLPGWTLPAAAVVVIVGSGLLGIYSYAATNTRHSYTASSAKSTPQPVIPVWVPGDDGISSTEQPGDTLIPTPVSIPTQPPSSGAAEEPADPWAGERMEAASQEPFVGELQEPDEAAEEGDNLLLHGASDEHASRPTDSVPYEAVPPSSENTTTSSQDLARPSTDQQTDLMPEQALTPIAPPDPATATETVPPSPADATSPWSIEDDVDGGSDNIRRVLMVGAPRALGEHLATALNREPDLEVAGRTNSATECRNFAVEGEGFDVSIVELSSPDGQGTDLIKELRRSCPHAPVLVLTPSLDPRVREQAMNAGAAAVLGKDAGLGEVISAVRRLSRS